MLENGTYTFRPANPPLMFAWNDFRPQSTLSRPRFEVEQNIPNMKQN